jgi:hypothetical protein
VRNLETRIEKLEQMTLEEQIEAVIRECEKRSAEEIGFFVEHGYWPEAVAIEKGEKMVTR